MGEKVLDSAEEAMRRVLEARPERRRQILEEWVGG